MSMFENFFKSRRTSTPYGPVREELIDALDPHETMRLHLRFEGRVQGVGFRFTQWQLSSEYDISGWVRNLPDGSVEAEWQGTGANIQGMVAALHAYYQKLGASFRVVTADPIPVSPNASGFTPSY